MMAKQGAGFWLWGSTFLLVLIWSAINPLDRLTWWLEVSPALIVALLLIWTRCRFPLTVLSYILIWFHACILFIGGHYTYAEVPFFDALAEQLNWTRNNFDKLGHFAQGFVPVIIAREILIRHQVVNGRAWLHLFAVSLTLAFSAFYELIEWWVALLSGSDAVAFLGTQGYVWDTQSDMAWALSASLLSLLTLSRIHDRQISQL